MKEQACPHYSVFVARVFGRAALVLGDKYPNNIGCHLEPYVIISSQLNEKISQYGKTTLPYTFGRRQYVELLIKDNVEGKYPLSRARMRSYLTAGAYPDRFLFTPRRPKHAGSKVVAFSTNNIQVKILVFSVVAS
jgi:hypothetical protein